ncbi:DUF3300 domain-containing protein [Sulfitobacter sp. LCG007]
MQFRAAFFAVAVSMLLAGSAAMAQQGDADAQDDALANADLLGESELQVLVAPVALFPDTLLVQILVAATSPLDVIKADRLLDESGDATPEEIGALVSEEDWDESVSVLAEAFPDVLSDMAEHVEWTESIGTAMLAQSDDVLAAIQTLRQDAVETGALESGAEQTVEVSTDNTVVIQPTDPQIVYVPQYQPQQVFPQTYAYGDPDGYERWDIGDTLASGAIAFGAFALIDDIFDDDDDWHGYWGCRDCGGWNGGPIIRDPDIDLDIDGNVNIANRVNIDRDEIRGAWKPGAKRRNDAREKIIRHRKPNGDSRLHIDKSKSRGDKVRENIAKGGDRDLAAAVQRPPRPGGSGNRPGAGRPGNGDGAAAFRPGGGDVRPATRPAQRPAPRIDRPKIERPKIDRPASNQPKTGAAEAIKRNSSTGEKPKLKNRSVATKPAARPVAKPAVAKPAIQKPADRPAARPAADRKASPRPAITRPAVAKRPSAPRPALQKSHSAKVTRAASSRGHASRSKGMRRR